ERGLPEAQFGLGRLYQRGQGVEKDPVEALRLFRLADEAGFPSAAFELGVGYMNGVDVERDPQEAHVWLHIAGLGGMAHALKILPELEAVMDRDAVAEARQRAKKVYMGFSDESEG
ncbi:MAG: sel1 repeat family protein, partial [bacterium]|nr:sel1 repeat family protein [bacterium]